MANSKKVINFGAGPSKLPEQVMQEVQKEFVNYKNTGISVIEMSHRSFDYNTINTNTQNLARDLLKIPDNYTVLFLQGGGTGLFAAVAMNLMTRTDSADYVVTGSWSAKAAKEAEKYGKVNLVLPKRDKYLEIPDQSTWKLDPNASYVYYCDNETVNGVEFPYVPDTKDVPLVADMSSNFMSRPIDVQKEIYVTFENKAIEGVDEYDWTGRAVHYQIAIYVVNINKTNLTPLRLVCSERPIAPLKTPHDIVGETSGYSRRGVSDKKTRFSPENYKELNNTPGSLKNYINSRSVHVTSSSSDQNFLVSSFGAIFAGAQKNIGPAGVVMVIIRKDLLGKPMPICPLILDFTVMHKDNSLHNTPPTFSVFVMMRVLEWVKQQGGVEEMERRAVEKSTLLYDAIDASDGFYVCHVKPECRSRMNVPFRISAGEEVEAKFLSEAQKCGMMQLKGHRSVGGIRASIYNAVTIEETKFLVHFMQEFQKANSQVKTK